MTLAENVVALQTRLATAQREYNRAEGARDTARQVAETARQELKRDFGVATVADAEHQLDELRQQLTDIIEQISAKLDEAEA